MSNIKFNEPACVFNCNCEDCNPTIVNPSQSIIGTGATQGVSNNYLDTYFYTKEEVDEIALSGVVDLSNYYTKMSANTIFQPIGNYVSASTLNNYYTSTYIDSNYYTNNYINNNFLSSATTISQIPNNIGYINYSSGDTRYVLLNSGYTNPSFISNLNWNKIINTPTTLVGYNINSGDTLFDNKYLPISSGQTILNLQNELVNYYTKDEADMEFITQPELYLTLDGYQELGNYVSASTLNNYLTTSAATTTYLPISSGQTILNNSQSIVSLQTGLTFVQNNFNNYYTNTQSDINYQSKGNYLSGNTVISQIPNDSGYISIISADTRYQPLGIYLSGNSLTNYLTLSGASTTYLSISSGQTILNLQTGLTYSNSLISGNTQSITTIQNNYLTNSGATNILTNYYTSGQTDNKYSPISGSTGLTTVGIINNGTWSGTSIGDNFINSASVWNNKQNYISSGTSLQYLKGDGTLANFPTSNTGFTNDAGYLTSSSGGNLFQPLENQRLSTINSPTFSNNYITNLIGIGTISPDSSSGKAIHVYNNANTGTIASNSTLILESVNRNVNFQGRVSLTGGISLQALSNDSLTNYGGVNIFPNSGTPYMQFMTSGVERLRISPTTGFIGVNTSSVTGLLTLGGNISSSAWGLNGINFQTLAATYTDTSTAANTTVTNNNINSFGVPTLSTSNTGITYTNAATVYIAGAPLLSGVTITNAYALQVASGTSLFGGLLRVNSDFIGTSRGVIGSTSFNNSIFRVSGAATATSGLGRLQLIDGTVTASANNDVTVGLDIAPTFSNGAFTGVANYAIRVIGSSLFGGNLTMVSPNTSTTPTLTITTNGVATGAGLRPQLVLYNQVGNSTWTIQNAGDGGNTPLRFLYNNTDMLRMYNNGNTIIGGTVDAGYKLDIQGTMNVSSGITSIASGYTTGGYTSLVRNSTTGRFESLPGSGVFTPIKTITSATTLTVNDGTILVDCTSAGVSITLPVTSGNTGQILTIKKIDSTGNAVTLVGTVDGVTNPTITIQYNVMTVQSNGIAYYKV